MAEFDRSMIFMPLSEAQRFFNKGDSVDVLEVIVEDPEDVGRVCRRHEGCGHPVACTSSDWRQRNESFFTVLEVERNMMFIILSIIVLVAAFNIISGLMMLVKDKGRDIGILRTMGASQGCDHARFPHHRSQHRRGRHPRRLHPWHPVLLEDRRDPPVRRVADQHQAVRRRHLLPDETARGPRTGARRRPSSAWRWCCRCWRRSIPPGALPGSIPSKRCATSRPRAERPLPPPRTAAQGRASRLPAGRPRDQRAQGRQRGPLSGTGSGAGRPVRRRQVDAAARCRSARDGRCRPGLSSTGRTARS